MLPDYAKYDLDQPRRICSKLVENESDLMRLEDIYKDGTMSMASKIIS